MSTQTFIDNYNHKLSQESRDLVIEFFIIFSRFECALKASGFFTPGKEKAIPWWEGFAASIGGSFDRSKTELLDGAVKVLLESPPRVQRVRNAQVVWEGRPFQLNDPDSYRLALSIRDIRNNLFHGGKFNGQYEVDIGRNYVLISSAILILQEWLELNEEVKTAFFQELE